LYPDLHVTSRTPPTFLLQAENDHVDNVNLVAPTQANETWTMDFLQDALASGRKVRTLSIEDA
jgi:hypothetical protein